MIRREPVLISTVTAMPGRKIDFPAFDLHLSVVERHAGGVDQFLAFRLAAARFRSLRLLDYSFLWLVAGNGVVRDGDNLSGQQAIAREIERVDLDRHLLPDLDETDVAVRDHRLNLKVGLGRYDGRERLRQITRPPIV